MAFVTQLGIKGSPMLPKLLSLLRDIDLRSLRRPVLRTVDPRRRSAGGASRRRHVGDWRISPRLRAVLEEAAAIRGEVGDAHNLLTRLRGEELVRISNDSAQRDRLEDLVHAARILVSELDAWALVEDDRASIGGRSS